MTDKQSKSMLYDEARVYEAVLENLPHDRFALERLRTIYLNCGEPKKADDCAYRLKLIETGEIDPDNYQGNGSLISQTKRFFKTDSKINELIDSSSNKEIQFFELREKTWVDMRPQVQLLIKIREEGYLDAQAYLDLCRQLKLAMKSSDHLWKGIVSHFPDCDRLNYEALLKSMQVESGLEYVDLSSFKPSKELEVLPKKLISHCELLIFSVSKSEVSVAMLNPFNDQVKQLLREYFTLPVKFYLTDVESFNTFVKGR